jgi:hypothetical protein
MMDVEVKDDSRIRFYTTVAGLFLASSGVGGFVGDKVSNTIPVDRFERLEMRVWANELKNASTGTDIEYIKQAVDTLNRKVDKLPQL